MARETFYDLFIEQLRDVYSAETQLISTLPKLISAASSSGLKEALKRHREETQSHQKRLKTVFTELGISPAGEHCKGMEGLLREANEILKLSAHSAVEDAAIICAVQKIEHYEIATYGTLCAFAHHLGYSKIQTLLYQTLQEEHTSDQTLTKLAEGTLFSSGLNTEAVKETISSRLPTKKKTPTRKPTKKIPNGKTNKAAKSRTITKTSNKTSTKKRPAPARAR